MFQSVAYIFNAFLLLAILGICKENSKKFLNKRVSQKFWNEAVTVSKAIPGGNRYKIHSKILFNVSSSLNVKVLYVVYWPVQVVQYSSLRMDFAVLAIILVPMLSMRMDRRVFPIFF